MFRALLEIEQTLDADTANKYGLQYVLVHPGVMLAVERLAHQYGYPLLARVRTSILKATKTHDEHV